MSIYADYLQDLGDEIKRRALDAVKQKCATPGGSDERMFQAGRLMAFNEVISLMQQQALGLGLPLEELRLSDIEPDRDLV